MQNLYFGAKHRLSIIQICIYLLMNRNIIFSMNAWIYLIIDAKFSESIHNQCYCNCFLSKMWFFNNNMAIQNLKNELEQQFTLLPLELHLHIILYCNMVCMVTSNISSYFYTVGFRIDTHF